MALEDTAIISRSLWVRSPGLAYAGFVCRPRQAAIAACAKVLSRLPTPAGLRSVSSLVASQGPSSARRPTGVPGEWPPPQRVSRPGRQPAPCRQQGSLGPVPPSAAAAGGPAPAEGVTRECGRREAGTAVCHHAVPRWSPVCCFVQVFWDARSQSPRRRHWSCRPVGPSTPVPGQTRAPRPGDQRSREAPRPLRLERRETRACRQGALLPPSLPAAACLRPPGTSDVICPFLLYHRKLLASGSRESQPHLLGVCIGVCRPFSGSVRVDDDHPAGSPRSETLHRGATRDGGDLRREQPLPLGSRNNLNTPLRRLRLAGRRGSRDT